MARDPKEQAALNKLREEEMAISQRQQALEKQGADTGKEYIQISQQKLRIQNQINTSLDASDAKLKKIATSTSKIVDSSKEYSSQLSDIADLTKQAAGGDQRKLKTAKAIQGVSNLTRRLEDRAVINNEKISKWSESTHSYGQGIVKRAQAYQKVSNKGLGLVSELASIEKDRLVNNQKLGKEGLGRLNTSYAEERLLEMQNEIALQGVNMTKTGRKELQGKINAYSSVVSNLQAEADLTDLIMDKSSQLAPMVTAPFEKMKGILESLPGGGMLSKVLGLDAFGSELNNIVMVSIQAGLKGGLTAGIAQFKAMTAQSAIFGKVLSSSFLPLAIAAAAIAAIILLFQSMSKLTQDISKNQGLSANAAERQAQAARDTQSSMGNSLSSLDEIVDAQGALTEAFGNTTQYSAETAGNIADLSSAFGIAVNDAAAVQAQFQAMGQSSEDAFHSQALAANLADAAGVAPGKVMKDIAQNGKKAAKYFGGATKELTKAAVEAAKLGMSLGDMVDIADGLLDIESSVTAEFEASVMLGREINMDKARQLALEGDIAGAAKAALEQAGSLQDLNNMTYLQRKKIAEAAGMEVGQLMDAAKKQEELNNMTAEQRKRYEEAEAAMEGATLSSEDIVAQQEAALAAKEMGAQFDKIKNSLMKGIQPLIKGLANIFTSVIIPALNIVSSIFSGLMTVLSPVFWVVEKIGSALKAMKGPLTVLVGLWTLGYLQQQLMNKESKISLMWAMLTSKEKRQELITSITLVAQQGLKNIGMGAQFVWEQLILTLQGQGLIIDQGRAALRGIIAMWTQLSIGYETTLKSIQSKGLMKTIGQAAMTVYKSAASIPYIGWILGAAAAAAVVGLGMSFMSDGVVSPQAGGGGFGKRVLYGPEGAISFNNKDTIVAGTNLNYGNDVVSRANDAIFRPAGAIKMNDGVIGGAGGGDMPDPPESMIVDYSSEAMKKMAVAVGLGTLMAGMALKLIPQMTFELNPFTFSPLGGLLGMLGGGLAAGAVGMSMAGGEGEGEEKATLTTVAEKLDELIALAGGGKKGGKASEPVQIVIGNRVIEEIGSQINVNKSYEIGTGSGGEE